MIKIGKILCRWPTLLSAAFLMHGAVAQADVSVSAAVDRHEMSVGDTFTYAITVSSDASVNTEDPRLPNLQGFELINSWTGSESRSTFANGTFQVQQSRTFNYMLATTREGEIEIGPAQIVVNGQEYQTRPVRILVRAAGAQPSVPPQAQQQPPANPLDQMENLFNQMLRRRMNPGTPGAQANGDDLFFIQAFVDKKSAYVGQQLTANWYLYSRGQIHDIDTLNYPSLSGFWKEEIELATRLNFQQEVVNGVVYQKALLASYALFPIKPGKASVDAYRAKCTVSVPVPFGFTRPQQFTKGSTPIPIEVLALPEDGKPKNFTGAVGRFEITGSLEQTNVPAHQPMTLVLRIQGRGNAKLIDLPPLQPPPGFELYDSSNEAKFFKDGTSYKQFKLVFVPRQAGTFTFAPVNIGVFDPDQKQYYEVASAPLTINVLAAPGPQASPNEAPPSPVAAQPQGPRLPDLEYEWKAASSWSVSDNVYFWTGAYALSLIFLAYHLAAQMGWMERRQSLMQKTNYRFKRLEAKLKSGDYRGVGVEGTNLINFVLGEVSGRGGASLEMEKLLLEAPPSVRRELSGDLQKLKDRLELLSFAPEDLLGRHKEKDQLQKLAGELQVVLHKAVKLGSKESLDGERNATAG